MVRFILGDEHAAGWVILDGRNMSVAYFNATTVEEAKTYVEALNVIDDIRRDREREERELRATLLADFGGGKRFAA